MSLPALFRVVKVGAFPYEAYQAQCSCPNGEPVPSKNYAGHQVAPPRCSICQRFYQLQTERMKA